MRLDSESAMGPEVHRETLVRKFTEDFRAKYDKGQAEHGGKLWEHPDLLRSAIEESLDLVAYLYTLRYQQSEPSGMRAVWPQDGFTAAVDAMCGEITRISKTKAPIEHHSHVKCCTILAEEIGEAASAVLHHDGIGLYQELKQIAAFAVCWMAYLNRREGKIE